MVIAQPLPEGTPMRITLYALIDIVGFLQVRNGEIPVVWRLRCRTINSL